MADNPDKQREKPKLGKNFIVLLYRRGDLYDFLRGEGEEEHTSLIRSLKEAYPESAKIRTVWSREDQSDIDLYDSYRNSLSFLRDFVPAPVIHASEEFPLHFVEVSKTTPGLLAYYQSEDKRAAGVRTPIKPGRYLKRYFPALGAEEIQRLGIQIAEAATPPKLLITQDADEIEKVYLNGPRSCMSKSLREYKSKIHPVRAYAGPDLALGYIGSLEEPKGRAIIWPERKIYGRIYGDTHRLTAALLASGYTHNDNFNGARILKIFDDEYDAYVAPYIDNGNYLSVGDEYLIINDYEGELPCRHAQGFAKHEPHRMIRCEMCEERFPHYQVRDTPSGMLMCEDCRMTFYFTCHYTGRIYDKAEQIIGFRDRRYGPDAKLFFCDGYKALMPLATPDYEAGHRPVKMASGEIWSNLYFKNKGFTDQISGLNYPISERIDSPQSIFISEDTAKRWPHRVRRLLYVAQTQKATFDVFASDLDGRYEGLESLGVCPNSGYIVLDTSSLGKGHDCNGMAPGGNGWFVMPNECTPTSALARQQHQMARNIFYQSP